MPSTAWSARLKTWSTKPYSLASSRAEPAVAVGVLLDLLDRLAGVLGDEARHLLLDVEHLLGLDLDVGGRAADAARGLVHHDAGVRRGVALALACRPRAGTGPSRRPCPWRRWRRRWGSSSSCRRWPCRPRSSHRGC